MVPFKELISEGGMESFYDMLEGEELVKEYKKLSFLTNRSSCVFGCIKALVGKLHPRLGKALEAAKRLSLHEYLEHVGRVSELRAEWVKYWR